MTPLIATAALAYLLGSIPSSVWLGRLFFDVDVRQHGSGNPGATNTFRVLGKPAGVVVLLLDVSKGVGATLMARLPWLHQSSGAGQVDIFRLGLLLGMLAVLGHVFSVFLRFRGGKGVATLLGVVIALHWQVAVVCVVVFLVVVALSHYVSLASILATLAYPLSLLLLPFLNATHPWQIYLGWVLVLFIIFTHRKNLGKIIRGTENKTYLFKGRHTDQRHGRADQNTLH